MSKPIVVTTCMLAPPNRDHLKSNHVLGTHVPLEEPSTAPEPTFEPLTDWERTSGRTTRYVRFGVNA